MPGPAPIIWAATPTQAPAAGGSPIEVIGANLDNTTTITIGGAAATGVVQRSQFYATAITPAHAAGPVNVAVTTTGGGTTTATGLIKYV